MLSDIEIARQAQMKPVAQIAEELEIPQRFVENYGHYKAKLSLEFINELGVRPNGKLILMTGMSPTPAGEGKTTTVVGLADALHSLGHKTAICLREPSLGPVFGMKGGAAGGGYAQVVPMEDINLHFTGDFGAIQLANNLLAALLDNHIHHGNELGIDVRRVTWKRVLDMNDRALRDIVISLGGTSNGYPRQDSFDIVVASEVMAILCLSTSIVDLKNRLGKIIVAYRRDGSPVTASDLKAHGSMAVLLKDAIKPNLVQSLEGTPAFIHGGPFANIAHGCNSVIATQTALKLADYVVTEAGFGSDLGAEKFINIKSRASGIKPDIAVVVATMRAINYHGGVANLQRHVDNVRNKYGLPCVVALNHFATDTEDEIASVRDAMTAMGVQMAMCKHWAEGGKGAIDLANMVLDLLSKPHPQCRYTYEDTMTLWDKAKTLATQIYGASDIAADSKARKEIDRLQAAGFGNLPVCMAKTQYSFSSDAHLKGVADGHVLEIKEVRLRAGAGFVVFVCGDILTMPGLPKVPAAGRIDLDDRGNVIGLA